MANGPYFYSDPISLTLAADHQLSTQHPNSDVVWQISLNPQSEITLNTSLGLQAQTFQLLPMVSIDKVVYADIHSFISPPRIDTLWNNYISLVYTPDPRCQVRQEFWVSQGYELLGRITIENIATDTWEYSSRVAAKLVPINQSQGMTVTRNDSHTYLKGQTGNLQVSVVIDGIPKPFLSPLPSLDSTKILSPNQKHLLLWRCVIAENANQSKKRAFADFPERWEAQIARLDLAQHSRRLSISTPDPNWDIVFDALQNQSQQLLWDGSFSDRDLFVLKNRSTLTSFPQPGETLYTSPNTHNFPNALELFQLTQSLLPANPELAARLFRTFLKYTLKALTQPPSNSQSLSFPCLCTSAGHIHAYLSDLQFIESVYADLRALTLAWFTESYDRDLDGLPEWSNLEQTGLTGHRVFDLLNPKNLPTHIRSTEQLGLGILLQQELQSLQQFARLVHDDPTSLVIAELNLKLQANIVEMTANNQPKRDRDTHTNHPQQLFYQDNSQSLPAPLELSLPSRIHLQIKSPDLFIRKPREILLSGENAQGQAVQEKLLNSNILTQPGYFYAHSQVIYKQINNVSIPDSPDLPFLLYTADLNQLDISDLLICQASDPENFLLEELLEAETKNLTYGIPEEYFHSDSKSDRTTLNVGWNILLVENLISHGELKRACTLFERLINAIIKVLKQEHALTQCFDSRDASPIGRRNAIAGLIGPNTLLRLAGIQIINPKKVIIAGENPFSFPLTIRYQGLEITRDGKNTTLTMPDGTLQHHFGSSKKTFEI